MRMGMAQEICCSGVSVTSPMHSSFTKSFHPTWKNCCGFPNRKWTEHLHPQEADTTHHDMTEQDADYQSQHDWRVLRFEQVRHHSRNKDVRKWQCQDEEILSALMWHSHAE